MFCLAKCVSSFISINTISPCVAHQVKSCSSRHHMFQVAELGYCKWKLSQFSCNKTKFAGALHRQLLHLQTQAAIHHPVWVAAVLRSKRWRCHVAVSISSSWSNSARRSLFPAIVSKTRALFETHCLANQKYIWWCKRSYADSTLKNHKRFGLFNLWIVKKVKGSAGIWGHIYF